MSTYRELVFMVSDLVKTISDDAIINENHIMYLLGRYRTYLLKQKYEKDAQSSIPSSNYQTICADLIEVPMMPGECSDSCACSVDTEVYLRTKKKLPETADLGTIKAVGPNIFRDTITVVSPERMEFVGYNSWLQNIIYGSVAPDNYMYFKSNNQEFLKLKKVHITAIFDNPIDASSQMLCEDEEGGQGGCPVVACDEMDREFPMEDALLTQLMSLVIRDILGAAWRPKDSKNNANDDLAEIANFIRSYMKKDYTDVIQG